MIVRTYRERLRAPGVRAIRDAGPRERHLVLALVLGGLVSIVFALIYYRASLPLAAFVIPPFLLTLLVSTADRDGPVIRAALAYVGLEQRRRASSGARLPFTREAADRWLAEAHPDASPLEHASVFLTAGRLPEAREAVESFEAATPADRVRKLRMRDSVAAAMDPAAELDLEAIRVAAAELPAEERRYHLVSAAWTRAWLDLTRGRPWRARFLEVARRYAPYELPLRIRALVTLQQHIGPLACVLAAAGLLVIERLL